MHSFHLLTRCLLFGLSFWLSPLTQPVWAGRACTGAADCTACQSCHGCQHCANEGGTCGVKERLQAASAATPQPATLSLVSALAPTAPTSFGTVAVAASPASAPAGSLPVFEDTPANRKQLEVCIKAIASQSDPAKLATLGSRHSNPRLKRIMYYLATARSLGCDPAMVTQTTLDRGRAVHDQGSARAGPGVPGDEHHRQRTIENRR